ncbi:MAG: protein kinase [Pleurocapsa minor GSE-CHR-MK-17-07R]|jgi:serine/threonine protein kinase/DNA-binding CsgD family transcriptional regulator|nr:protein kinase [Pleurocapsa minor GSE-CHR-MK 17-07R]
MIGRVFRNRYEVLKLLGEGSTATVYLVHDRRLNRQVALKVLLPHVRESVQRRFVQEATAAAQLSHPNIMLLYDVLDEDGMNMLVVEYVEGDTLSDRVPSPPEQVVEMGRQIALALHHAHERNIIHRDVKPANIKITPEGQIKIMDLGLALPREAKRVTAAGMIIGTPAYLSPEQAQAQPLDRRTDIYSLGVVLFELATGELPFSQDDIPALLLQHVKDAPPMPRSINPSIPPALESVILKALEKNPAKRFQTAESMANALESVYRKDTGPLDQTRLPSSTQPARPVRASLRIMLADDHTILRKSLASFLSEQEGLMIVGEAGDGDAAITTALDLQPDVLLLDLNMPRRSGMEALPELRRRIPSMKVLILTGRDEEFYIMQALRLGAHGYMLKSSEETDLVDGIFKVAQGGMVLGSGVAEKVISGAVRVNDRPTEQERQLLLLVAAGLDNEDIAARLGLPLMDVIEALASVMDKLGARDRNAAALTAIRRGYVLLDELQALN